MDCWGNDGMEHSQEKHRQKNKIKKDIFIQVQRQQNKAKVWSK